MIQARSRPVAVHIWALADSYSGLTPLNGFIKVESHIKQILSPASHSGIAIRRYQSVQQDAEAVRIGDTFTITLSRIYHHLHCILIPTDRRRSISFLAPHRRRTLAKAVDCPLRPYKHPLVSLAIPLWFEYPYAVRNITLAHPYLADHESIMRTPTRPV